MKLFLSGLLFIISISGVAQLTVNNNQTVEWYIQNVLVGTGVTISNVQFNAGAGNVANEQVGSFIDPNSATGLANGLILGSGDVTMAAQPNTGGGSTLGGGTGNGSDPDLAAITPNQINDECIVEFDFIPTGDSIVFSYVFASEEYEEYVCGSVNDAFGFFLTGTNPNGPNYASTNLALVPDPTNPSVYTNTAVSINTVNPGVAGGNGVASTCAGIDPNWASYNIFYAGANAGTDYEYDGNTVVLDCRAAVVCGQTYHIKLAIGDGGDGAFDSGVFLEGGSFSSPQPVISMKPLDENGNAVPNGLLPEGCLNASILFIKPVGFTDSLFNINLTIGGTATNGVDYTQIQNQYVIPVGQDSLSFNLSATLDGVTEGTETLILSTLYTTACDTILISDTLFIVDVAANYNLILQDTVLDCPTDSLLLTVDSDGGIPNIDYVWGHSNEMNDSVWTPINTVGVTYFPVSATDFCGITSLDSIKVTLNPSVPPNITFVEDYIFTCVDQQNGVNIAVDSIGNAYDVNEITYSWFPGGGSQDNVNVFPTNTINWYYLTVYDGCNTVTDSLEVEVGRATIDSISIVPALGCSGQGNAAGVISVFPVAPNWSYTLVGNGATIGPQTSNVFNNLSGNLVYNLLATDPMGCILDSNVFVTQANATLMAILDQAAIKDALCYGSSDGEAAVNSITGGINLPNGGPYDITWTHSDGTNINGGTNIPLNGGGTVNSLYVGGWQVLVVEQNSGCAWSEAFEIGEPDTLTTVVEVSDTICYGVPGGSINILGLGGTVPYSAVILNSQGVQVNSPGTVIAELLRPDLYSYTFSDANGCSTTGTTKVLARQRMTIEFDKQDILCYGRNTGSVNITDVHHYGGSFDSLQFLWTPAVSGGNGGLKLTETGMAAREYLIDIQDQYGCISDTLIRILDAVPIEINMSKKSAYCRTNNLQNGRGLVSGFAEGGAGNFSLKWKNVETGQTLINIPTWASLNPGTYELTVIDNNNCIASDQIVLDSINPVADFVVSSEDFDTPGIFEGTEPVKVKFDNESIGYADSTDPNNDVVFQWSLNATSDSDANWFLTFDVNDGVDTTYLGEDIYLACLVASNYNDCADTHCVEIAVRNVPELIVPNVFTPGQNPNNLFYFPNVGIETFSAVIFNRYGEKIYEFDSIDDAWDGNHYKTNKPCSDGVYFIIYEGESTNGTPYSGEGTVTLLRNK